MPDVKMPDGTIIRNVPEGTTKAQLMAKLGQPQGRGFLRRADDLIRGIADAATFGYADEFAAKMGALTGLGGQKDNYQANLAAQRQRDRQGGGERLAGQIIGAVALPTSKLSAAKGLKGLVGTAAEGAAYGAAYGSGSAEEGKRLRGATEGAKYGAGGGLAGRAVGATGARILRGKQVSPAVRLLANEGMTMTPGQRGGSVAKTYEESILGSIPFIKAIPQAAKRKSVEQLNVATYNRVLKPLGQKLPMSTTPGRDAVGMVGDTVFTAYDDATSKLGLGLDSGIDATANNIKARAKASVGQNAGQLKSIIDNTLEPLMAGPLSGAKVRDLLQDLRGEASSFKSSSTAGERRLGDELWKMHDELEAGLTRQNAGDVLKPFQDAREAVSLYKRVESAAAKSPDGVFNPTQLRQAITKRGYGTTVGKVATGRASMQDLADAAKQVLPATVPNSGTPERAASLAALGGPGAIGAFVDPTMGIATGLPLLGYAPGIDKLLQHLALNRPDLFIQGGNALSAMSPALGTAGAFTAINQGR